jgi:4,5-DOPA dioxygenase extradiol
MALMSALFIGHGGPMNTLEVNRYTHAWGEIGHKTPKFHVFLAVSAH